jgi:hypothetical protein
LFKIAAERGKLSAQSRDDLAVSPHLASCLVEPLRDILPGQEEFEYAFARFEYLAALSFVDWTLQADPHSISWTKEWAPSGLYLTNGAAVKDIRQEMTRKGARWPLVRYGLFGGSIERLQAAATLLDQQMSLVRTGLGIFDA